MKVLLSFILFYLFSICVHSETGVPPVLNITKNQYSASGQNWAINSDADGRIYIGNSKGLLLFYNGKSKLFSLPQGDYIRAILIHDQRIYVGSFEEFGFFERDIYGMFNYTSLSEKIDYTYKNEQIESINLFQDKIYFQSSNSLFIYNIKTNEIFIKSFQFSLFKNINNKLYAHKQNIGIGVLDSHDSFKLLIPFSEFNHDVVVSLSAYDNDKVLLLTAENGIYIYDGYECKRFISDFNNFIGSVTANNAIMTNDSTFIIGTLNNGLYAFNKAQHLRWNINTSNGLQNNTVHSLTTDNYNNIWVALDNGFSCVQENSDIRFIKPFKKDIGSVFSAIFHNNYLYVATNQGLFYNKNNMQHFDVELLSGMSGKTTDLQLIDNRLICSHDSGTYEILGEKVKKLSNIKKASSLYKGNIHQQEVLIQPTNTYLNIYKKDSQGVWYFSHSIEDFLQPIYKIEIDMQGNIWVSHLHKGLFCVKLNSKLTGTEVIEHYTLPDNEENRSTINLFKIKGRVVFRNKDKYYTYDDLTNQIIPFKLLNENLSTIKNIQEVIGIDDETYWCITPDEFIKIRILNNYIKKERYIPFSYFNWDLPDYNKNMVYNGNGKFNFCLNNGIATLNENLQRNYYLAGKKIEIESIKAFSESNSKYLDISPEKKIIISYALNNLSFNISSNHAIDDNIQYVYKLSGLKNDLVQPTSEPHKEYHNLSWGNYIFEVSAYDGLGNEFASISYDFEIIPPFYASKLAYTIYIVSLICSIFAIYFLIKKYIRRSNEKIAQEQEKLRKEEQEIQEREIIKLKNINLESELTFKSKELANIAITLTNRDKVLLDMKSELEFQKDKLGAQFPNKYYNKLIKFIDTNLSSENNWKIFQTNFDRIHDGFFRNLKENYPELTPNDLKLCSLLRLNLSTKDIASFLGITVRGAEFARYRLRKKLNLPTEKNIVDFLIEFK